jgi:DNA polymerase III sliding clamp (beta) subunit (PCNA family)
MKFTVSSKTLYDGLSKISGLIGTNNIISILDNSLLKLEKGKLTAISSDIENSMKIEIEVDSDEEGSMAIPAKKMLETLKFMPEQPLLINMNEDEKSVEFNSSNGKYKLAGFDANEFPKIPEIADTFEFEIGYKFSAKLSAKIKLFESMNSDDLVKYLQETREEISSLETSIQEMNTLYLSTLAKEQKKEFLQKNLDEYNSLLSNFSEETKHGNIASIDDEITSKTSSKRSYENESMKLKLLESEKERLSSKLKTVQEGLLSIQNSLKKYIIQDTDLLRSLIQNTKSFQISQHSTKALHTFTKFDISKNTRLVLHSIDWLARQFFQ